MRTILDCVSGDLSCVPTRLKAFRTGLPLIPEDGENSDIHEKFCLEHIHNVLVVLDLYLIETDNIEEREWLSKADLLASYNALTNQLISLIVLNDIIGRGDFSEALRIQGEIARFLCAMACV